MTDLAGIGAALAAMHSNDEHRYDGLLIRSALPDAPMVTRLSVFERIRGVRPGSAVRGARVRPR